MCHVTSLASTIITGVITIIVGLFTLFGVMYQSNKNYDKQQEQLHTNNELLKQEFNDYKEFLHQLNKDLKHDIEVLSSRVDEHNSYGIKIPVIEEKIERINARLHKLENQ